MPQEKDSRQYIKIRGANEHNLKNVDVDIPRDKLVVLTGCRKYRRIVSGYFH